MYGPKPKKKVTTETQLSHEDSKAAERREIAKQATKEAARTGKPVFMFAEGGVRYFMRKNGEIMSSNSPTERNTFKSETKGSGVMAKGTTNQEVGGPVYSLSGLTAQVMRLEKRVAALEGTTEQVQAEVAEVGQRHKRVYTAEERAAIGVRLQTARAKGMGLTLEELRALKLRPGAKPTAADIKRVRAELKAAGQVAEAIEAKPTKVAPKTKTATRARKAPAK